MRRRRLLAQLMLIAALGYGSFRIGGLDAVCFMLGVDRGVVQAVATVEPTVANNPFGQAVDDELPWESRDDFLALCEKYAARIRMGAFQTILPDPLPGEEANVARAADLLAGQVLQAGEVFGMNPRIGPYTAERGFKEGPVYSGGQVLYGTGGGVCKMATTLYNTATLADLPILERHAHGMLVPYSAPGQDATVSYWGRADLKFKNDTGGPIVIWADTRENTLWVAFYGSRQPPKVTWHHEILGLQERNTVYRHNPDVPAGTEKVTIAGADGITVNSWLTLQYPDGSTKRRDLGVDYYRPLNRIVEHNRR